jgi:uncharacterized membrane protein
MQTVFEFFFKHSTIVFTKGEFAFAAVSSLWVVIGAFVFTLIVARFVYQRTGKGLPMKLRGIFIALRFGLLAMLLFCLLQPVMVVPSVVPQTSYVAVLVDDSKSMGIKDQQDRSRTEAVRDLLATEGEFYRNLTQKFRTRFYRFSTDAGRIDQTARETPSGRHEPGSSLTAAGPRTNLAAAIQAATTDLQGMPLAGVVLLTDGANNTAADLGNVLSALKARQVPVYSVGVGQERHDNDAELLKVNVPKAVLKGSSIDTDLLVRVGQALGQRVTVSVAEDGRTIKVQEIELKGAGETQSVHVEFVPTSTGAKRYTFGLAPQPNELIVENNTQEAIVNVRDEVPRLLYVEGEPRWEYGKIRSAVREDKQMNLVSVVRTAGGKFYRQGVEGGEELATGFPKTQEELFKFKGLVLGSVEAGYFTFDQLRQIEEFVSRRGGGLLMLGGTKSFSAGGYAGSPLADVLPVYLKRLSPDEENPPDPVEVTAFTAAMTKEGKNHPVTKGTTDKATSATIKPWESLPRVTLSEVMSDVKPGALTLLEGHRAGPRGERAVMLASQRYGKGVSLAFPVSDSWRWQMELDVADLSHETFWRQMLRYLVSFAAEPVSVSTDADAYDTSDVVRLRIEANDKFFNRVSDAQIGADVTSPSGRHEKVPLEWVLETGGQHQGRFVAKEHGVHHVEVEAKKGNELLGTAKIDFYVGDLNREYRNANQNTELLKHLAGETKGRYFPLDQAGNLPDVMSYVEGENSMKVAKEMWDMPILFLLMIGLMSTEWFMRKRRGLA